MINWAQVDLFVLINERVVKLVVNQNRIFAETLKAETAQTKMAEMDYYGRNRLFWPKLSLIKHQKS